jgi:hypothetical protein
MSNEIIVALIKAAVVIAAAVMSVVIARALGMRLRPAAIRL